VEDLLAVADSVAVEVASEVAEVHQEVVLRVEVSAVAVGSAAVAADRKNLDFKPWAMGCSDFYYYKL